jgi:PAS domain S-box-containing protein
VTDSLSPRLVGRLAGTLFLLSGLVSAVSLPFVAAPGLNVPAALAIAVVSSAFGAFVWFAPWERWHPRATLAVVVPALALIAAGNATDRSSGAPYSYGVYFVLLFAWIGLGHPQWTAAKLAVPALATYTVPFFLPSGVSQDVASAAVVIPVCVMAGESIAWIAGRLRRAEAEARASDARLRLITSQLPAMVWTTDRSLTITSALGAGLTGLGLSADVLVGRRLQLLLASREPDHPAIPSYQRALQGESVVYEREFSGRPHRTYVEPLRGADGKITGCIGLTMDVTEQKRAEDVLREAYEREREAAEHLRTLDRMKNSFLEAVSHELRTPLAVVLGTALTLERPDLAPHNPQAAKLLERLVVNAQRLESLLLDLLDLDRLTRGIVEPHCRPTDVAALVRRVVESADLDGRAVEVRTEPAEASVDAAKVERIVENLVTNAARHTPSGSPMWVRVQPHADGVEIAVEDAGPGIPDELKHAVFDPFSRGPVIDAAPGTGIGLSLVARFAELHGGRAWVEDRPGGGSSFHVFLPHESELLSISQGSGS